MRIPHGKPFTEAITNWIISRLFVGHVSTHVVLGSRTRVRDRDRTLGTNAVLTYGRCACFFGRPTAAYFQRFEVPVKIEAQVRLQAERL